MSQDLPEWLTLSLHVLINLAFLGAVIFYFARTRSLGFALLIVYGILSTGLFFFWRFVPQALYDSSSMGRPRLFLVALSIAFHVLTIGLLIAGVLCLMGDIARARRGEWAPAPVGEPFSHPAAAYPYAPPPMPPPPPPPAAEPGKPPPPWEVDESDEAPPPTDAG